MQHEAKRTSETITATCTCACNACFERDFLEDSGVPFEPSSRGHVDEGSCISMLVGGEPPMARET